MPSHAPTIARWFHLPYPLPPTPPLPAAPLPLPRPGQILLLTGPSGSGKSTLLRHLHHAAISSNRRTLPLPANLPDCPTIDTLSLPLPDSLHYLSLVGLAEAHTYLLPPRALSEGQRWRLRLAVALARATSLHAGAERSAAPDSSPILILADEFAALLDRVTALTLSHALRRLTTPASNLCFALATSHSDLVAALAPDVVIRCDFGSYSIDSL